MSGEIQKHNHHWAAYAAGACFLSAAALLVWMLLKDWAKLIPW